jgi:hypothetical protein
VAEHGLPGLVNLLGMESPGSLPRSRSVTTSRRSPKVSPMRNLLVAMLIAVTVFACSKPKPTPAAPPPAAAQIPQTDGAAHIAIAPDGVHVQYRVYGSGEPALVFIHGWSGDSNYWREQTSEFSKRYTLVTVDLAGHGRHRRQSQ